MSEHSLVSQNGHQESWSPKAEGPPGPTPPFTGEMGLGREPRDKDSYYQNKNG